MEKNKRNIILVLFLVLSFCLGWYAHGRLCSFFKGHPVTDEASRSYLFYMRTTKRLVEAGEVDKLKAYVNEAYAIKEHLFLGMADPVAFEFFFRWENHEEMEKCK